MTATARFVIVSTEWVDKHTGLDGPSFVYLKEVVLPVRPRVGEELRVGDTLFDIRRITHVDGGDQIVLQLGGQDFDFRTGEEPEFPDFIKQVVANIERLGFKRQE